MRVLMLKVELVELTAGLWCRTCALSTGIQATVYAEGNPIRAGLSAARRCTECDGHDLEPVGPDAS